MKKTADLIQENIENLQSLWRTASLPSQSYQSNADYAWCFIEDSDWPNRLWFHHDIRKEILIAAKKHIQSLAARMVVPYLDVHENNTHKLLEEMGFQQLFEQTAMYLPLGKPYAEDEKITLRPVSSHNEASLWSALFQEAFHYFVNPKLLWPSPQGTSNWIVYHQNDPVGTALLHISHENTVVGIHCIGIVPQMRRKGLAEQLMKKILNLSLEQGFKYATLQASAMGIDLYLKLGFEQQFTIRNYILSQPVKTVFH